jgi:cytochrome c1
MALDWHMKEQQAAQDAQIEERKAAHQLHLEGIKAGSQIQIAREKNAVDADAKEKDLAFRQKQSETEAKTADKPEKADQNDALMKKVVALLEQASKPKKVIRDGAGRLVGVE